MAPVGTTTKPPTVKDRAKDATSSLRPMSTAALRSLKRVPFNVYIMDERTGKQRLFLRKDYTLGKVEIAYLERNPDQPVFMSAADDQQYCDALTSQLDDLLEEESIPPAERLAILKHAVADRVEHSLKLMQADTLVNESQAVGRRLSRLLSLSGLTADQLFRTSQHDYNTFTHVVNVASYCVMLAEALGITDESELETIASGGMLHDIGKRFISGQILNKPERLTDDEMEIVKTHPQRGFEELRDREEVTREQLMMVYQHHERVDGRGYPVGITGKEMHDYSRICAVVDVFEALTGERPYRSPMTRACALNILKEDAGTHFDPEMVQCWANTFQRTS